MGAGQEGQGPGRQGRVALLHCQVMLHGWQLIHGFPLRPPPPTPPLGHTTLMVLSSSVELADARPAAARAACLTDCMPPCFSATSSMFLPLM